MRDDILTPDNLANWLTEEIQALDSLIYSTTDPELIAILTGKRDGYQIILDLWEL